VLFSLVWEVPQLQLRPLEARVVLKLLWMLDAATDLPLYSLAYLLVSLWSCKIGQALVSPALICLGCLVRDLLQGMFNFDLATTDLKTFAHRHISVSCI
jgi:hypothetical protein